MNTETNRIERLDCLYSILSLPDKVRVVDIGANPMSHDAPYKLLLEGGFCDLVGFEPQEETLLTLNERKGPNETYIPAAVGDGRRHNLNLFRGSGLASFLNIRKKTIGHLRGLRRAARPTGQLEIETSRLDDIPNLGRVDFLKIDIQGGELSVFENGTDTLRDVIAIQTEVNFFPLYDNQPSFGDIDVHLRKQGFLPHSYQHIEKRIILSEYGRNMPRGAASQMLDGDILYLKDISSQEEWDDTSFARLALIADGVYGYVDLALYCLEQLTLRGAVSSSEVQDYLDLVDPDATK